MVLIIFLQKLHAELSDDRHYQLVLCFLSNVRFIRRYESYSMPHLIHASYSLDNK